LTYTEPIDAKTGRDNTPNWVYVWVFLYTPEQVEKAKKSVGTLGWDSQLLSTVYQYPVPPKVDITSPRQKVGYARPRIKATLTSEVGFPASPSPVKVTLRPPDYDEVLRPDELPLKDVKVSGGGNKLTLSAFPEKGLAAGTYTLAVTATDLNGVSGTASRVFTVIDH